MCGSMVDIQFPTAENRREEEEEEGQTSRPWLKSRPEFETVNSRQLDLLWINVLSSS